MSKIGKKITRKITKKDKVDKAKKNRGTGSIFNFDGSLEPLVFSKITRNNTQKSDRRGMVDLNKVEEKKKNNRRGSISNYSIISIQKEKDHLQIKMNNIIEKSPTLSKHRRKSSFMMNLPQTLKKVMNLQAPNQNFERRKSFQSGIISLNPKNDSDGLSAIESEESSESPENVTKLTTTISPEKSDKLTSKAETQNKLNFYKDVYNRLKRDYFKEIRPEYFYI